MDSKAPLTGITAIATYLPRLRLERAAVATAHAWANPALGALGKGRRAVAGWDEDVITMASEAAAALVSPDDPDPASLTLASTTLPFADRQNAGIVAAAIDLAHAGHLHTQDVGGSQRAATSALIQLLKAPLTGGGSVLIAAEQRPTRPGSTLELTSGDAAAAVQMGTGAPALACLGSISTPADFVDHYRASGAEADYVLEDRWLRDEAITKLIPSSFAALLAQTGLTASDVSTLLLALPNLAHAGALAKALKLTGSTQVQSTLPDGCGHGGTAQPLLLLAHALETARPGQVIVLCSFASGCDLLAFRVTDKVADVVRGVPLSAQLAGGQSETNYLRVLSFTGAIQMDWGLRAERDNRTAQSVAWRKSRDVYAFVGGRCTVCGTVQFPRTRGCVNPNCREMDSQEPYRLARSGGMIKTFTEDWQAHTPDPPLRYGNIGFAEGGNALMEIADAPAGGLAIGQNVRFAFRIKDHDERRNFRRYFWKAVPVEVRGDS